MSKKRIVVAGFLVLALGAAFGAGTLAGANRYGKPKSVIQVVTIKWAADTTPEQREAAIQGIEKMAAEIPGIKNVWLKPLHVEPRDFTAGFALEFEDQAAAERYFRHPGHEAWDKIYIPLREESRSQQITN